MRVLMDVSAMPPPAFITRSIEDLAKNKVDIYILGQIKGNYIPPHPAIKIINRPKNIFYAVMTFLTRFIKLYIKDSPRAIGILRFYSSVSLHERIKEFNRLSPFYIYQPDIIHIQWTKAIVKFQYLLENKPCKILVSVRGTQMLVVPQHQPEIKKAYIKLLPLVDAFHVVSEDVAIATKVYTNAPLHLINAGIELSGISYIPFQKSKLPELKILCISRFHWVKGIPVLLDALALLKQQGMKCSLTLVTGDAPNEEYIYQVHDLGLKEDIVLKKSIAPKEVYELFGHHDVFVLPSISEGKPNALLEAMAAGLPVICSAYEGVETIIQHGKNGWLYQNQNAVDLCEKIKQYIQLPENEIKTMAENARQLVESEYSLEKQTSSFIYLYQSLSAR